MNGAKLGTLLGAVLRGARIVGEKHQTRYFDEVFVKADLSGGSIKYWGGLPRGYVKIPFTADDIDYLHTLLHPEGK